MAEKKLLTAQAFDELVPRLGRMTTESVAIARKVLVDGKAHVDVAAQHDLTKARVGHIVNQVLTAARDVPSHWRRVVVWLPPELARQVEEMAAKAKDDAAAGRL